MERHVPSSLPALGDLTQDAAAAMRSLAGSTVEPFILAAFPWFVTNPYQALLYGSCREHGIAPVRVVRERTWAANGAILRDVYGAVLERWAARRADA